LIADHADPAAAAVAATTAAANRAIGFAEVVEAFDEPAELDRLLERADGVLASEAAAGVVRPETMPGRIRLALQEGVIEIGDERLEMRAIVAQLRVARLIRTGAPTRMVPCTTFGALGSASGGGGPEA
jgi:hypothetical protein